MSSQLSEPISKDDELYIRIAPESINPDGSVSSSTFRLSDTPERPLVEDLVRLTTLEDVLSRVAGSGMGIGVLPVDYIQSLGLSVRHDPLPPNNARVIIEGVDPAHDKEITNKLAKATVVLVQPSPLQTTQNLTLVREGEGQLDATIESLCQFLVNDDSLVRAQAARDLANTGMEQAIPYLQKVLISNDDPNVRVAAAKALGKLILTLRS